MLLFSNVADVTIIWKGIEGLPKIEIDYISLFFVYCSFLYLIRCQHALLLFSWVNSDDFTVLSNFSVQLNHWGEGVKTHNSRFHPKSFRFSRWRVKNLHFYQFLSDTNAAYLKLHFENHCSKATSKKSVAFIF